MTNTLTDKQAQFVSEYLIDLNATQAAIRAGYSVKTAKQVGSENLSKPDIAEAIQKAKEKAALRNEITVDSVTKMHKKAFDVATEAKNASAMTTTANNLAKLHGLIVVKTDSKTEISTEGILVVPSVMSPDEWAVAAKKQQEGLMPDH